MRSNWNGERPKKYQTYKVLAEAFKSGELDPKKFVLILDNDNSHLTRIDLDEDDPEFDCLQNEARELFEGQGCHYEDVLGMLEAAGIPAESV